MVDVDRNGVSIKTFYTRADVDRMWAELSGTVIFSVDEAPGSSFFSPLTCVSFARHATGVPSRALLPDGLYRDLLRVKAEKVHDGRRRRTERNTAATQPADQG